MEAASLSIQIGKAGRLSVFDWGLCSVDWLTDPVIERGVIVIQPTQPCSRGDLVLLGGAHVVRGSLSQLLSLENLLDPGELLLDLLLNVLLVVLGQVDAVHLPVLVFAVLAAVSDVDVLLSGLGLGGVPASGCSLQWHGRSPVLFSASDTQSIP